MTLSPGSSSAMYAAMVGVRAGVRLHVGVLGAEQRARARAREFLGVVDDEVAAVVALAGIALGVLVGEHRALRLEHRRRREVLRRDQLDRRVLALELAPDDVGDLGIGALQRRRHRRVSDHRRRISLRARTGQCRRPRSTVGR